MENELSIQEQLQKLREETNRKISEIVGKNPAATPQRANPYSSSIVRGDPMILDAFVQTITRGEIGTYDDFNAHFDAFNKAYEIEKKDKPQSELVDRYSKFFRSAKEKAAKQKEGVANDTNQP